MTPRRRLPTTWNNGIAYPATAASTKTRQSTEVGVLVPLFPVSGGRSEQDHGALLGEAFVRLREMSVAELEYWISAMRRARSPGCAGA